MSKAVVKQCLAKIDQVNLKKVKDWWAENEGNFFKFHPYCDPESKDAATDSKDGVEDGKLEDNENESGWWHLE